jgi:putative restriction endonuclease
MTRVPLRLADAAHILPVGAPESADHVRNGIALAPTYHRAFDNDLIYLDEECRMQMNMRLLRRLEQANLNGGVEAFRTPLGRIFLPPDPVQRPSIGFIRRANRFRRITT